MIFGGEELTNFGLQGRNMQKLENHWARQLNKV